MKPKAKRANTQPKKTANRNEKIFVKWWDKNTKSFSIVNYKKSWRENGNKPRISFHHNHGKKINGDNCFDATLIIGYTIFNYTNWDLQKYREKGSVEE